MLEIYYTRLTVKTQTFRGAVHQTRGGTNLCCMFTQGVGQLHINRPSSHWQNGPPAALLTCSACVSSVGVSCPSRT